MTMGSRTVLVVDSRPGVRELLKGCLEEAGFAVLESADRDSALACCAEHSGPIDLLIVDNFQSRVDGFRLAEEARRVRPGLPAILLGAPRDHRRGDGIRILPRPFTLATLLRNVQKIAAHDNQRLARRRAS